MRVVKFGGSSVADIARLRNAASIVAELRAQGPVAVVVSAMAGVTDALLRAGRSAITGDAHLPELLEDIELKHYEAWSALSDEPPVELERQWATLTQEARALGRQSAGRSWSARERLIAQFSGWGERLVVGLLAAALREVGLIAEAFDDAPVALHDDGSEEAEPQPSALSTRARLLPRLALLVMRGGTPVLPGYIARSTRGGLTTLGRNGSDHSAAVIAAALGAERLTIYSDVPGMLTADPRIAPDAELLPALTYAEAQRMARLGAKALHPRTIEPVVEWGIPLELRSSRTPHAPGTEILSDVTMRGRAREGSWIVVSRPLPDARSSHVEVTAAWLPAWPRSSGDEPPCDALTVALTALHELAAPARAIAPTADGLRALVDVASAPVVVRALHAALHRCSSDGRHERSAAMATGA